MLTRFAQTFATLSIVHRRASFTNKKRTVFLCYSLAVYVFLFSARTLQSSRPTASNARARLNQVNATHAVNYLVTSIYLAKHARSQEIATSTNAGVNEQQKFFDFKKTLWWRSLQELGMPGVLFVDFGENYRDSFVRATLIPESCIGLSKDFSNVHPFDVRWLILDCIWRDFLSTYDYVIISDLGDIQFLKSMHGFFESHLEHDLFLMVETELDHPFQRDRFGACFGRPDFFREKLPFNGGFQAGRERVVRSLVRELVNRLKQISLDGNTKCLELSCDQALLTKVVYENAHKYKPLILADLHPPYAKAICATMAKQMYHVVHKNQLVDIADPLRCSRLLADAYNSVGKLHPTSSLTTDGSFAKQRQQ